MSKRFKGKSWTYCVVPGISTAGDHVVAREFFPVSKRANLPQVPACDSYNRAKAELEHYATAVLPFGATNAEASATLATMVPPRLKKNQKLARSMAAGAGITHVSQDAGRSWDQEMGVPLDAERLERLWPYIVRGLAQHEFKVLLPDDECVVTAHFMGSAGRALFDSLLALNGERVGRDLGNGVFMYEGLQSPESPRLTIWRMSVYGAIVGDDERAPVERTSLIGALTGPRSMPAANEFVRLLQTSVAPARSRLPA